MVRTPFLDIGNIHALSPAIAGALPEGEPLFVRFESSSIFLTSTVFADVNAN